MKIQIYGIGCPKCKKLAENAEVAARELGLDYEIEKITDIKAIVAAGVMMTPGMGVNGKVVLTGSVPAPEKLKKFLND